MLIGTTMSRESAMKSIHLDAALQYAALGLPVLPIRPFKKAPLIEGGAHVATTDPRVISEWWRRWPMARVALSCGERAGFDALDIDKQHGGIEVLGRLLSRHKLKLPKTSLQSTPSGGFHILFCHRPGLVNRCGVPKDGNAGMDCRTNGAQIITAPAEDYRWRKIVPVKDLPPWPDWLAEFYLRREPSPLIHPAPDFTSSGPPGEVERARLYINRALERVCGDIERALPGTQENTLHCGAFQLGALLNALPIIPMEDVINDLVGAGLSMTSERGKPPWTARTVQWKVNRGVRLGYEEGTALVPNFGQARASRPSTARPKKDRTQQVVGRVGRLQRS